MSESIKLRGLRAIRRTGTGREGEREGGGRERAESKQCRAGGGPSSQAAMKEVIRLKGCNRRSKHADGQSEQSRQDESGDRSKVH